MLLTLASHVRRDSALHEAFALCFQGELSHRLSDCGSAVHMLPRPRFSRPYSVLRARHSLRALIARERFDVVVCHAYWAFGMFGPAAREAGAAVVLWAHDRLHEWHYIDRLASLVRPDVLLANSNYTASTLRKRFDTTVVVVNNPVAAGEPVSEEARRETRRSLRATDDQFVIVMASRLQSGKGHRTLLRALTRLRDNPSWICWIAGGPQRSREEYYAASLRAQVRLTGLGSRVAFLGQRRDVPRLLAAADAHCQPNHAPDSFGLVFVEALYAGLPVVTSAIGGALEIVDDTCGKLVPSRDPAALEQALRALIAAHVPGSRSERAKRRAAQLCAPEIVIPKLHDVYEQAVRTRGRPSYDVSIA